MANLSNINNKFLVTTGGEVLVGRTAATGTSKLQVTGSLLVGTDINSGIPFVVQETTADGFAIGFMRNTNSTAGNGLVIDVNSTGGNYIQDWRQAGNVKMRLLQNGNLGIGTDLPSNLLHVNKLNGESQIIISRSGNNLGTNSSMGNLKFQAPYNGSLIDYAYIYASSNNLSGVRGSLNFSVKSTLGSVINGMTLYGSNDGARLGIGTTSPVANLEVASTAPVIRITNTTDPLGNGTVGSFEFFTNDSSTGAARTVSSIVCDNQAGSAVPEGQLVFKTSLGGSGSPVATEKMRIDSSGVVSITNSGGAVLKLQAGTNSSASLRLINDAHDWDVNCQTNDKFAIYSHTDTTERLVILPTSGNVGIGTNSPDTKLEVDGKSSYPIIKISASSNTSRAMSLGMTDAVTHFIDAGGSSSNLIFKTVGSERMRITSGGIIEGVADISTYTNKQTVFAAYADTDLGEYGIALNTSGDSLEGSITSNLKYSNGTSSLLNTARSSAEIKFANTTTAGSKSAIIFTHGTKGSTTQTEAMRVNYDGNILVQATSSGGNGLSIRPNATAGTVQQVFNRASTTSDSYIFDFQNGGATVGYIRYNNTTTTYATSSDYRLKEDLQDFAGLDMVSKIPVYDFKWKSDESRSYGVMAHELQEVLPDAVSGEKDAEEMQGVDYSKIVPLLVKAIQELKAEIELLKSK